MFEMLTSKRMFQIHQAHAFYTYCSFSIYVDVFVLIRCLYELFFSTVVLGSNAS